MRTVLILALLLAVLQADHVLQKFQHDIVQMREKYFNGDTSRAFSIAMRLYLQTKALYKEMGFEEPIHNLENYNQNCSQLLGELQGLFLAENWIQLYQQAYGRLTKLQATCTNSDFSYGKVRNVQGFDDKCALCTVITKIMENYIVFHRKNVTDFIENQFCSMFDGVVKPTCEAFTHYFGPLIIKQLIKKQNPDVICLKAGMCKNPQCKIIQGMMSQINPSEIEEFNKPSPWEWIVHLFTDRFGDKHLPPFDLDNDTFSDISTFRGYHWRGADCDEMSAKVYPGRKTGSTFLDHDCNGIFGKDVKGHNYEDKFCKDSKRYGVVVIGDSAGAHFSIPERFFNVTMMHKGTFKDFLPRVADELDIPHESGYTGHTNTQYLSHSVYKYLRNWNLCNNNDYQNLGVNGGDSGNTWGNIKALKRDNKNDYPLLMFLQLIGNDVCAKDFDGMTKPADFKRNILRLLNWLDETVPQGSHLVVLGLADGDLLYDYLHDSMHPLNVTYTTVYNFLNCLKISPCWGWLNSDDYTRKKTTQRAKQLSQMYLEIINDGTKFKNFDMVYYDFPTAEIIKRKELEGGDPRDMIEPCDGFHPSGEFHSFLADWLWYKINEKNPEWIGQQNPHNEQIRKIFGLKDLH